MCVLLHASIDVTPPYLQALAAQGIISADAVAFCGLWGVMIVAGLLAVVVLVATRGRLGYPRYQVEAEQLDLDPAAQPASPRRIAGYPEDIHPGPWPPHRPCCDSGESSEPAT